MSKLPTIHEFSAMTEVCGDDDSPVLLDMSKAGLQDKPVLVLTTMNQINLAIERMRTMDSTWFFNLLQSLGKSYQNLDYIYRYKDDKTSEAWNSFNADCVLYCAYRHFRYKQDLPIMSEEDKEKFGIKIEVV